MAGTIGSCLHHPHVECAAHFMCAYCGWNPAVTAERKKTIRKTRQKMLADQQCEKTERARAEARAEEERAAQYLPQTA